MRQRKGQSKKGQISMSDERRQELKDALAQLNDWEGVCQKCGTKRRGTLGELALPCPGCQVEGVHPKEPQNGPTASR